MADQVQHNDQQPQDPEDKQILAGIVKDMQTMDEDLAAVRTQTEKLSRACDKDKQALDRLEEHVSGRYLQSLIENQARKNFFDDPAKVKEAYRQSQRKPRPRR